MQKYFNNGKAQLRQALDTIHFTHVICLFLTKNDKNLAKVNSIVLINKSDYLDKMCNILSDSKKFVKSF